SAIVMTMRQRKEPRVRDPLFVEMEACGSEQPTRTGRPVRSQRFDPVAYLRHRESTPPGGDAGTLEDEAAGHDDEADGDADEDVGDAHGAARDAHAAAHGDVLSRLRCQTCDAVDGLQELCDQVAFCDDCLDRPPPALRRFYEDLGGGD